MRFKKKCVNNFGSSGFPVDTLFAVYFSDFCYTPSTMKQQKSILDYRVILRLDKSLGSKKSCYVAFCPTLGVADDGATPQEAIDNIQGTIAFHIECLQKERKEIPVDKPNEELVTNTQVPFSPTSYTRFAF